ncbi:MAG: hypothetical protein ACI8P3_004500 [Saprospiraceae bacterium]|jgi:hypothetical protein
MKSKRACIFLFLLKKGETRRSLSLRNSEVLRAANILISFDFLSNILSAQVSTFLGYIRNKVF